VLKVTVDVVVELDVGEAKPVVGGLTGGATQDGPGPGHDLRQGERLGHVVVAARSQPGHLVVGGVHGGEERHRDLDAVGAQAPGHLDAVEVGQHHVEHDQVRRVVLGDGERGPPGVDLGDIEALVAQRGGDGVGDRPLVVDDQHPLANLVCGHVRTSGPQRVAHRWKSAAPVLCATCEAAGDRRVRRASRCSSRSSTGPWREHEGRRRCILEQHRGRDEEAGHG